MANMQEAIDLLHEARNLIQRYGSQYHKPTEEERQTFLAASESFIADGCGHKVRYWKPDPEFFK